jgi:2-dehydro-3-deoxygalactonokinase
MTPALVGIDWGTTSFRAYLMDALGSVLDRVNAPLGILQIENGAFEAALERLLAGWLADQPDLPIILSGMIGSRQGWVEVPYLPCPAGIGELSSALHGHTSERGRRMRFVPGLVVTGSLPDVLRGEETQIVGALADPPSAAIFLLPGTHSKWARVEGGRVVWFATFMTGEVYSVLRQHSILGRLMTGEAFDEAAFARGARAGLDESTASGGLLRRLFSARSLGLVSDLQGSAVASYLSGLLIGSEVREAIDCVDGAARSSGVVLVGGSDLVGRYTVALRLAGVAAQSSTPDAAARGQHLLAETAGLLE